MTAKQTKWDMRFLRLAREVSTWSKDPSTKVGAVIVRHDLTIASVGFNGLPQDMPDDPVVLHDPRLRLELTIHAEMNAVFFANEHVSGHTLFTYPVLPCCRCAVHLVQKRIGRVVTLATVATNNIPKDSYDRSRELLTKAGIEVTEYEAIA